MRVGINDISSQLANLESSGIMPAFTAAARSTGIDRNLLLAVASRESNMGLALDSAWLGDNGYGIGLMQIDRRYHPKFASSVAANNHQANVLKGAQILKAGLDEFGGNVNHALAAYNAGAGNVRNALSQGLDPDLFTTDQDYARDVVSRYQLIRSMAGSGGNGLQLASIGGLFVLALLSATAILKQQKEH